MPMAVSNRLAAVYAFLDWFSGALWARFLGLRLNSFMIDGAVLPFIDMFLLTSSPDYSPIKGASMNALTCTFSSAMCAAPLPNIVFLGWAQGQNGIAYVTEEEGDVGSADVFFNRFSKYPLDKGSVGGEMSSSTL